MITGLGRLRDSTMACGQGLPCFREFAIAQGIKETSRKDDALSLSPGEPLIDQNFRAPGQGIANLRTEPACQRMRLRRDELAVEPCRAARPDLAGNREVRPRQQAGLLSSLAIGPCAGLDDRAGCGIAGPLEVGKAQMMRAAVDPVDDGIGLAGELVVQSAFDQPSGHALAAGSRVHREASSIAAMLLCSYRPVHGSDDVSAIAELAKRRLQVMRQRPAGGSDFFGQSHAFEHLRTAQQECAILAPARCALGPEIDDTVRVPLFVEAAVETGPALGVDLAAKRLSDIALAARTQLDSGALLGAGAQPFADIATIDDEILPIIGYPADQDMDVRVVGVPVINRHPVEARIEVAGHVLHQLAGESAQIGQIVRVLRRDDKAEVVPVVLAALREGVAIGAVGPRIEHLS